MLDQQLRYLTLHVHDVAPLITASGRPVLQVSLHSQDGALKDSDAWTADPQGMWTRSRVGSS
jgi:hypothetical protein